MSAMSFIAGSTKLVFFPPDICPQPNPSFSLKREMLSWTHLGLVLHDLSLCNVVSVHYRPKMCQGSNKMCLGLGFREKRCGQ
jgi:hypothetical protein